MPRLIPFGPLAALILLAADANAQAPATLGAANRAAVRNSGHPVPAPSATAVERTSPIALDGALSEEAWSLATPVTEFTQWDPEEGKPATQRTEVRFLFDDAALYIGAKLHDTEGADGVRTQLVRRDEQMNSDFLEIVIDAFHDHLGRAFFRVNPSGSKGDDLGIGTSCCDSGWDPVWEAATEIDADGWTAEIRIPFSQLRFPASSEQTWGLQLRRFLHRRNELQQWSFWGKNETGGPSRFGHLEGLRISKASRGLEVLPYVAAKSERLAAHNDDPFHAGSVQSSRAGLDVRYSLSSNLTLDATVNPDFGQVEVDPAVVNLTAFETSFPEKRPFFVANSGVFSFGGLHCMFCSNVSSLGAFYSRRIGRAPSGADLAFREGEYAEIPDATTILGAAKVTGRTSNGWTIGVLNAVTNDERATFQREDGTRGTQLVEPLSNYFVGRLKKDLMSGNLVLGGIVSSVVRRLSDDFKPRLASHAEVVGADMQYTWGNRTYSIRSQVAFSDVAGDERAIAQRQRSSARYFQRPDRALGSNGLFSNRYDTTATSLRGLGGYGRIAKESGNWRWEGAINFRTPGFETNDVAFQTRADYTWANVNVGRSWTRPGKWYRDVFAVVGTQRQINFDGDMTEAQSHFFIGSTTPQFWFWRAFIITRPAAMDDRLLRGGPVVQRPGGGTVHASVNTDSRRPVGFSLGAGRSWNALGGWGHDWNLSMRWRPSTRINLSLGPSWSESSSLFQYVTTRADPTQNAFYGRRYIMSGLDQKQLALETRASMTFSPTMTFELFMQPLLASGHYYDFKEFNAPRQGSSSIFGKDRGTLAEVRDPSGAVTAYTVDPDGTGPAASFNIANPDFNLRSLRGNAVFRWEYRPGSVLYVAWTHARAGSAPLGDFNFSRDWDGLFDAQANNVLLVKASWWIPR